MSRGFTVPIPYGPNGCQVNIGNQTCQETQTLEIIKEFKRVYESKLNELSSVGGGDNLSAKLQLQQDWIRDLTQQNEMLVKAVEELEKEAADRVSMLEDRLQCGAQVMQKYKDKCSAYLNETFQKLEYLQNDVCNLVEFIKRVRDNRRWSIEGLQFYTINAPCLLKSCSCYCDCSTPMLQDIPVQDKSPQILEKETAKQDAHKLNDKLQEMEKRLSQSPTGSDLEELNFKLRLKDEELTSVKRRSVDIETDCNTLRKKFKELEAENTSLKDTIYQANRELEKFYEQANDYVKERDEYKRKLKECTDTLTASQITLLSEKQSLQKKVMAQEETIRRLSADQADIQEELINSKRQSESLNQAQNETIQALQEAIREQDKTSDALRPLTSDESWSSTTESTASKSCKSCPKSGVDLKKLQDERDLERQIHKQEVDNLKKSITELEKAGAESIKILEDAYEESKLEISQQRITISNLQEALKTCKNQLDDLQQTSSSDVSWTSKWFRLSSAVPKMSANNNQSVHDV